MIEASHFDFNTAYATVDRHQLEDFDPYIFRTRDMGKSWQRITTGLPAGGYVHSVKEDPMRQGLLVAGTEHGAWVSFTDGDSWESLQLNLPVTSVRDFEIYDGDLIVGTHGRGIWVIDDISPLRQAAATLLAGDAYLFKPADAINVIQGGDEGTPLQKDEPQAQNPPAGAVIDYYLKADSADGAPVTLEILDASGKTLHTFSSAAESQEPGRGRGRSGGIPNTTALWRREPEKFLATAGMHRVYWVPVADSARGTGRGGGGGEGFRRRPPLLTGTFTAKLTVNGHSYTQPFTVRSDPRME